jgi:hypothetical protein
MRIVWKASCGKIYSNRYQFENGENYFTITCFNEDNDEPEETVTINFF